MKYGSDLEQMEMDQHEGMLKISERCQDVVDEMLLSNLGQRLSQETLIAWYKDNEYKLHPTPTTESTAQASTAAAAAEK